MIKIRNVIVFLGLLLLVSCSQKSNNETVINFKVANATYPSVMLINQQMEKIAELDKDGNVSLKFDEGDIYAILIYGNDPYKIFIQDGAQTTVSFDGKDFNNTLVVEGAAAPIIEYLNSTEMIPLIPDELYQPFDDVYGTIQNKIDTHSAEVDKANLAEAFPHFVEMEKARIKYSYVNNLIMYPLAYTGVDATFQADDKYFEVMNSYFVEVESIINVDSYREFIIEASLILASRDNTFDTPLAKTEAKMKFIADRFNNPKVIKSLLEEIATNHLRWKGDDDAEAINEMLGKYVAS